MSDISLKWQNLYWLQRWSLSTVYIELIIQGIETSCRLQAQCNKSFLGARRAHFYQAGIDCCSHQWCMRGHKCTNTDVRESYLDMSESCCRWTSLCLWMIKNIIKNQPLPSPQTYHWSLVLRWLTASGHCRQFDQTEPAAAKKGGLMRILDEDWWGLDGAWRRVKA